MEYLLESYYLVEKTSAKEFYKRRACIARWNKPILWTHLVSGDKMEINKLLFKFKDERTQSLNHEY